MTLELPDKTITEGSSTLDLFTDRYGLIRRFVTYINEESPQGKILFFHGDGGNGKSLLLRFLYAHGCKWFGKYWNEINALPDEALVGRLQEAEKDKFLPRPTVLMDFGQVGGGALPKDDYFGPLGLAQAIRAATEEQCKFPRLTFARLCYEDGQGQADSLIDRILANDVASWLALSVDLASGSVLGTGVKLALGGVDLKNKPERIQACARKLGLEDDQSRVIRRLDPKGELIAKLPEFLIEDLEQFLAQKKIILMFDTHESFWNMQERAAEGDGYFNKDLWLRKVLKGLVKHPKIVLVVAGREPPRWSEATKYPIRNESLDLQLVEDLLEADARVYLQKAQVLDVPLQESMIRYASVGPDRVHPLYLGLCVDIVRAAQSVGMVLTPQEFVQEAQGVNRHQSLINRLFKYVDTPTREAVQALGACRSFDRALYDQQLSRNLNLAANFTVLTGFSFVKRQTNGRYRIHDLLRRIFDENAKDFTVRSHQILEKYYRENADIEFIYHLNRLDWEQSINQWVGRFDQACKRSRYELCRLLIDLRQDLWVRGNFELGELSGSEGAFYASLSQYDPAHREFQEAIDAYKRYLRTSPDSIGAHNNKGNALLSLGDLQAGRSDFSNALSSYQSAIAGYDQALALAPDYVDAHNNKGIALKGLGDLQTGRSDFSNALSNYQSAIAAYGQALALAPNYVNAHNNKGNALRSLGDLQAGRSDFSNALSSYQSAIAAFDQALALAPDDVFAHNNKGNSLLRLGDLQAGLSDLSNALSSYERAIAAYDQALALAPDLIQAHNNKGNALVRLGDLQAGRSDFSNALSNYQSAIAAYGQALALAPDDVFAHNNKGNALSRLGDLQAGRSDVGNALSGYQHAIAAYDQALALAPDYVAAHNNKGNALRSLGDLQTDLDQINETLASYQAAINSYNRALQLASDDTLFLRNQGNVHERLGSLLEKNGERDQALAQFQLAITVYDHLLNLVPGDEKTRQRRDGLVKWIATL